MSATQPASTTELKEYCLRKLGKPVIDVNLADEQMDDLIEESVHVFQEYHFDGTEVYYAKEQVAASTLTFASASTGTFAVNETITGGTSGVTATVQTVTSTTVLKFNEHTNSDGLREANTSVTFTAGETVTGKNSTGTGVVASSGGVVLGNVDLKALTVDDSIIGIRDVLPIKAEKLASDDMFSVEYQFHLNELPYLLKGGGTLSNYVSSRQYISMLDDIFSKSDTRQLRFNRLTDKVYIDMDWDSSVDIGDWLVLQCYKKIDGGTYTELYNDIFLKKYTTALFKKQWGQNLMKYDGMQLPGGVTLNGRQIYDDGNTEIEKLDEEMQVRYQLPDNFYVG